MFALLVYSWNSSKKYGLLAKVYMYAKAYCKYQQIEPQKPLK